MLAGVRETGEKPVDVFTDQEFGHEDALLLINAEVGVEDDASTDDLAGGRFEVYEGNCLVASPVSASALRFAAERAVEIGADGVANRTASAGGHLDTVLVEERYGSSTHSSTDHHVGILALDEAHDIAAGVVVQAWIGHGADVGNCAVVLDVNQDEKRRMPEVWADRAV